MKQVMRPKGERVCRSTLVFLLWVAILLGAAGQASAQQKDKKNKDASASSNTSVLALTDEQQVDYMISTMLGAWQVGDVEKLHQTYADDVTIISGTWNPPVIGWNNYLPLYQQQRGRMQQVRMDRSNTYIKLSGNFGWACYQWDFSAVVDGQPSAARGQTTLIVEKRNDRWVIVHNHTSLPPTAQPIPPANTPQIAQPQPNNPSAY